ncbi:unnamed protein product, partial [Symbiodinium microadriaticum]
EDPEEGLSECAIYHKLRRLCLPKKNGKLLVPKAVSDAYKAGGTSREELETLFAQLDFNKESFIKQVTTTHERLNQKQNKRKMGWNDKYDSKIQMFHVEYEETGHVLEEENFREVENAPQTVSGWFNFNAFGKAPAEIQAKTLGEPGVRLHAEFPCDKLWGYTLLQKRLDSAWSEVSIACSRLLAAENQARAVEKNKKIKVLPIQRWSASQDKSAKETETKTQITDTARNLPSKRRAEDSPHRDGRDLLSELTPLADEFDDCEVPCKDVILHARASSSSKAGVRELSKVPLSHSEEGVHKVLQNNNCGLPVEMDYMDLPGNQKPVPYVKLSSWMKFLGTTERLHYLTGCTDGGVRRQTCHEFWRRLQKLRPQLPIFQLARDGRLRLEDAIPVVHHGDEGRTYKKSPLMVLSTHGVLGKGSHQGPKKELPIHLDPQKLNFLGSTILTHYVFAVLPQALYKTTPEVLDSMLSLYASDLENLALNGIDIVEDGEVRHLWCWSLGVKGDLPYLGKAGHFQRTYSMCPKKSVSKKAACGICFMCSAGDENLEELFPWEDMSTTAKWIQTVGTNPGYASDGPLLRIPHDVGELFYRLDLWHVFHLGCGKAWAVNACAILHDAMAGMGNSEQRLQIMSKDFRKHCQRTKQYAYIQGITRDVLGWEHGPDMPTGGYHKGFVTTRLLVWL